MDNQGAVGGLRSIGHVQSSFRKRVPGFAKIFMLAQTVTIVSLSLWIYEEYLNNVYLRLYVSDFFQTEGWAIVTLTVLVGVGGLTRLLFRRSKTMERKVEAVSAEVKVPVLVAESVKEVSAKRDAGLHPAVAALKAELAGRPRAFGTPTVPSAEEPETVPAPKTEERKTVPADQPSARLYSIVTGPRTQLARGPVPVRPMPVLGREDSMPSAGTQPTVVPPRATPQNVTTVITGLMPVQKKKETEASAGEKPSSQ